jgi:hypothetical protein
MQTVNELEQKLAENSDIKHTNDEDIDANDKKIHQALSETSSFI